MQVTGGRTFEVGISLSLRGLGLGSRGPAALGHVRTTISPAAVEIILGCRIPQTVHINIMTLNTSCVYLITRYCCEMFDLSSVRP